MSLSGANKLLGGLAGSFDGHAHIFEASLHMTEVRRYTPLADAPFLLYRNILRQTGLDGGILVQPSFYGTDNSFLLQALASARKQDGMTFAGVVVLEPDATPELVTDHSQRGAIGLRLNLVGQDYHRFRFDDWIPLFGHANQANWHVEVQLEGHRLDDVLPRLLDHCETIVIDHFGLPDAEAPFSCPGQRVIRQAPPGRVLVKASAPYRVFPKLSSNEAARKSIPLFRSLFERLGPENMLWGSDWPWTRFEDRHSFSDTLHWQRAWLSPSATREYA